MARSGGGWSTSSIVASAVPDRTAFVCGAASLSFAELDARATRLAHALFARDQGLCLYCGREFHRGALTRDHVQPVSRGGRDTWENVVSACFHCNSRKGNRTPQQAGMPLLAVPYRPSWIEHLILSNRNILADQMAFLKAQLPKKTRLAG